MKRLLCLSLCLGLMASGCIKKPKAESDYEGGYTVYGNGYTVYGNGNTNNGFTRKTETQIIVECIPKINSLIKSKYPSYTNLFFRNSTRYTLGWSVMVWGGRDATHQFTRDGGWANIDTLATNEELTITPFTTRGLGPDGTGLEGLRVHISSDGPGIRAYGGGQNPQGGIVPLPGNVTGIGLPPLGIGPNPIPGVVLAGTDQEAGWYHCALNTQTQEITVQFRPALTTSQ